MTPFRGLPHTTCSAGGSDFFWALDFPYFDHTGDYMEELRELVEPLPESTRQKIIGENAARVYGQ